MQKVIKKIHSLNNNMKNKGLTNFYQDEQLIFFSSTI